MKLPRFAPLTGIAFVVLLVIGFGPVGGYTPGSDDSASKISAFYHDHQTKEVLAAVIVALAVIFFAMFIVALRDYLRGDGADGDFWPTVALVGGIVSVAGFCLAITVHAALVDGGHNKLPGDAMIALNALDNWDFFAFAFPLAIMLFGVAGATLKARGGAAEVARLGCARHRDPLFRGSGRVLRVPPHRHLDHHRQHRDVPALRRSDAP